MSYKWHFNDRRRKDPVRDPIQGEFFANEAIKNPEEALIREGIQNSLDAAVDDSGAHPVRIRVLLANGSGSASAAEAGRFMNGAWPHINAEGNGIKHAPRLDAPCPFLVFEDFGTHGLNGNVSQSEEEEGNLFFYFFRAEGRSEKLNDKRGRWGVGKHVFPSASHINSIFGLTVRSEDSSRYLMGRSVLKCHSVDGENYMPDGYFGQADDDGFVTPVDDQKLIDDFCDTFRISRKAETGLSIVIPWLNTEFGEQELISAVVRGYFFPILEGSLVVTVETAETSVTIDDRTIFTLANQHFTKSSDSIKPLLHLGAWAAFAKSEEFVNLEPADPTRPVWAESLLPKEQIDSLKKRFEAGERIAIRVPLTVRPKGKDRPPEESHFDIFLIRDGCESGRPVFVREGIIISGVKAPLVRGVRSLVVASKGALATLLGDAENPSHTEWLSASAHFGEKYVFGRSYLDFVSRSAYEFVRLITGGDRKGDPFLLLDLFSLPSKDDSGAPRPGAKKKTDLGESVDRPKPPPPKPKKFRLERVKGGFSVQNDNVPVELPMILTLKVAYDVRRGNPLTKYHASDFALVRAPIHVETQIGVKLRESTPNSLVVEVTDPSFKLALGGFDTRRDLFVRVEERKGGND